MSTTDVQMRAEFARQSRLVEGQQPGQLPVRGDHQPGQIAQEVAQGLKGVLRARREQDLHLPRAGIRYAPKDRMPSGTERLGPYLIVGDKAKGVEPGFIAKKDWTRGDEAKLDNPTHKFHGQADQLLGVWLNGQGTRPPDFEGHVIVALGKLAHRQDEIGANALKTLDDLALKMDQARVEGQPMPLGVTVQFAGLVESAGGEALKRALLDELRQAEVPRQAIKEHLLQNEAKFTKNHYIKLDYYESDRFMGRYQIPMDKAKSSGFGWLGRFFHRLFTGQGAAGRNEGAVREAMANDLMRSLGVESQKLKLVQTTHADGTPKLMLDGTHVEGFKDFDGDPAKGERYLKDGVIVRNDPDTGQPRLDTGVQQLGRKKIAFLLLGDRDALGSKGANKGYVGDRFVGIDPGHALEHDLMSKRGDVRSDFSCTAKGYKNFSLFDQSSLAEKMEGVRDIARLKGTGDDVKIFESYRQTFDGQNLDDPNHRAALDFATGIDRMRADFEGRRDHLLEVFAERLAVDGFALGNAGEVGSQGHKQRVDQTLNLLDGLEKLTSRTKGETASGIRLTVPQVTERVEWHVRQNPEDPGQVEFQVRGSQSQVARIQAQLDSFANSQELSRDDGTRMQGTIERAHGPGYSRTLTIKIPVDRIPDFARTLDYANIMAFKHPERPQ